MKKVNSTGSSLCQQLSPVQGQPCNDSFAISIRDQGALDLIRLLLDQGLNVRIQVSGESMKPTLLGGETVQISSLGGQFPRIGEILLLADRRGNPLIHRLIRRQSSREGCYVQTKGDACFGCDESVPLEQVLGRVSYILPPCKDSVTEIGRGRKDLNASFMRLNAFLIVARFLTVYFLRKAGTAWQYFFALR